MELEPGFKLSEAGVIPKDWDTAPLSEACTTLFDGPHHTPRFVPAGIPFYAGENVVRATFMRSNFIDEAEYRQLCRRAIPKQWDTLLVRVGDVGATALAEWKHRYHVYVNLAVLRPSEAVDPKYLYAYTKYEGFRLDLFDRSLMHAVPKKINMGELGKVMLAYPQLDEQRLIGEVLYDFDRELGAAQAELTKLLVVKQAAMDELLSPAIRLPGFRGDWVRRPLGQLCSIHKGTQLNRSGLRSSQGYPVWNGGTEPSGFSSKYNETGPAITISEGGNSCGFVNWIDGRFWCGGHCYRVEPNFAGLERAFLHYVLKRMEPGIQALRVGSGLPNVQKDRLADFEIMIAPSNVEQRAIAAVLTDIDAAVDAAREVVAKAKDIKAAATDALLSGRIRMPLP